MIGFIIVFILAGFISFATAADTVIKINTLSNHKLNLQFLNPEPPPIAFGTITVDSGDSGVVDYVFSNSSDIFDLSVFLLGDGGTILHERFNGIDAGKTVVIDFVPGVVDIDKDYHEETVEAAETGTVTETSNATAENETSVTEPEVNDTQEEVAPENENVSDNNQGGISRFFSLIGFASSGDNEGTGFSGTKTFYYAGGAFLLGIALFFVSKPVARKLKNSREAKKEAIKAKEETLEDAKRKLKEMQEKVDEMTHEKDDKIKAAKQKLVEDEKELMRLRGEVKKEGD